MRVLAIDPGNTESAWCLIDSDTREPILFAKEANEQLHSRLTLWSVEQSEPIQADRVAVEMIASYGMAVGAEVFETCVWIGRFCEVIGYETRGEVRPDLVKRHPVKLHHCHHAGAKDSNIIQALVDRFAPGQPNRGKGTKKAPGWFYGFHADVWQAYALAVYVADTKAGGE